MQLDHTDDASMLRIKLTETTNEVGELTRQLIEIGTQLNKAKGLFAEVKAKIRWKKEVISSLKIQIRAEGNSL